MPSEFADRPRPAKLHGQAAAAAGSPFPPPEQQEQLPCPRCDSTNTKFCYYNNYNFSQPRHFCKSCRRYWTRGGTLRDIPVGGGTRKNSRRSSRSASSSATGTTSSATPVLQPQLDGSVAIHGSVHNGGGMSADEALRPPCGSFTSLLTTQAPASFLALGGLGVGMDDMAFGLGRGPATWAFPGVVDGGIGSSSSAMSDHAGTAFGMGGGWQLESGVEGGGDCISWPELAISTPGNGA